MRRLLNIHQIKKENQGPGDDLLSHLVVSSALKSLTAVFGMETGVAPSLESPGLWLPLYKIKYFETIFRNTNNIVAIH